MTQFFFFVSPPKIGRKFDGWGYRELNDFAELKSLLRKQNLTSAEMSFFEKSEVLTYKGELFGECDLDHQYLENGKVVWRNDFPEIANVILLESAGVLCFYGNFERENAIFTKRKDVIFEAESQLKEFPMELNFMFI